MLTLNVLLFILAIAPSLRSVELLLFPPHTGVNILDQNSFEEAMKKTVRVASAFSLKLALTLPLANGGGCIC